MVSVAASVMMACQIEDAVQNLGDSDSLIKRREIITEVDKKGIIATPANSYINELVVEAARISILKDGANVDIVYAEKPYVRLRPGT
jgi:ABC-type proline/glycine betaine transport system ATPase subunit